MNQNKKKQVLVRKKVFLKTSKWSVKSTISFSDSVPVPVISEDCIACGSCISECPVEAISEGDIYVIDADVCTDCGTCADVCPSEAISPVN